MKWHPFFFFCLTAFGVTPDKEGLLLKTDFSYKTDTRSIATSKELILDGNMKNWVNLTNPKDGVLVLAKVRKSSEQAITFEFMVLDSNKDPVVVATPSISVKLGEQFPATLELDNNDDLKFSIGLTASKTTYRPSDRKITF